MERIEKIMEAIEALKYIEAVLDMCVECDKQNVFVIDMIGEHIETIREQLGKDMMEAIIDGD